MVAAIERGYPQREIAESAYRFQQAVESKAQVIVGVNEFVSGAREEIGTLYIDESAGERQLAQARRDPPQPGPRRAWTAAIERLQTRARGATAT